MLGVSIVSPDILLVPFTMTTHTWVVVFSRDLQNFGGRFKIDISRDEDIDDLKKTVKNFRRNGLSHVFPPRLTIWRCKDRETAFHSGDVEALDRQISKLLSGEELEALSADEKLVDLCISVNETLLVEAPSTFLGASHISTPLVAFSYMSWLKIIHLEIASYPKWTKNLSLVTFECTSKERS